MSPSRGLSRTIRSATTAGAQHHGLAARGVPAPGWSLLVRGVANLSKSPAYQMLEGIIETDTWFGPLFDNVRLLKTDVPIEFRSDVPFLQVQPVRKKVYADKYLQNVWVKSLDGLAAVTDGAIKLIITSPPYNIGKNYEVATDLDAYLGALTPTVDELVRGGRAATPAGGPGA